MMNLLLVALVGALLHIPGVFSRSNPLWDISYMASPHGVLNHLTTSKDWDVNFVDAVNGRTALMICGLDPQSFETLDADCAAIALMLLKRGARRSTPDYRAWTPLHFGASRGLTKYCEVLLKWDNKTILEGIVAPLEDEVDINTANLEGRTAAMLAAVNGHFGTVAMLLDNGANVSLQSAVGQTALHLATSRAITNTTDRVLVKYEAMVARVSKIAGLVDVRDRDNRTALMYAAMALNHGVVDVLLRHGADPTLEDSFGTSVMVMASRDKALQERVIAAQMDAIMRQHQGWLGDTEHIIREYERQVAQEHAMDKEQQRLDRMGFQPAKIVVPAEDDAEL